jgi:hypothetical protein
MAMDMSFRWDHTAWLNVAFLAFAAVLLWRFFRSGGAEMLRSMNQPMSPEGDMGAHAHHSHEHHPHGHDGAMH